VADVRMSGGGLPSVAARMSLTFLLKNSAKPSLLSDVGRWPEDWFRPNTLFNVRHNLPDET